MEECLRKCPSSYAVKARDRDRDLMIGGNTTYFMQGMGMRYLDLDTWETRPARAAEHRDAMIVADALENVHLADGVFFYMEREDVPPIMVMLENLASGLRHSSKAEHFGYQRDCEIFAIQMAQALGIGLNSELDTAFPLAIYGGAIEAAFRYVEADIPIMPCISIPSASVSASMSISMSISMPIAPISISIISMPPISIPLRRRLRAGRGASAASPSWRWCRASTRKMEVLEPRQNSLKATLCL